MAPPVEKSPEAFRTISEVADWLGVPAHVLRFWESKFPQVKPVKRAGGRRYFRPADMRLLGGIRVLLHEDGMSIKAVQKKLADEGVAGVAELAPPFAPGDEEAEAEAEAEGDVLRFARSGDTGTPPEGHAPEKPHEEDAPEGDAPAPSDAQAQNEHRLAPQEHEPTQPDDAEDRQPDEFDTPPAEHAAAPRAPEAAAPQPARSPEPPPAPEAAEPPEGVPPQPGQPEPTPQPVAPAPSSLPPLPDLPDDPPDDMHAAPGPLSRLAAVSAPVSAAQATALSTLAARLRGDGAPEA